MDLGDDGDGFSRGRRGIDGGLNVGEVADRFLRRRLRGGDGGGGGEAGGDPEVWRRWW